MATRAKLIGDVLFFLKDLISSNVTDPISAKRGSSSKFVMTSFPQREVKYPLITIEVSNLPGKRSGMQTTAMDMEILFQIRVWCKSVAQSDQLMQEISDLLPNKQFTINGSIDNNFNDLSIESNVRVDEIGEGGTKSRVMQGTYSFFNVI